MQARKITGFQFTIRGNGHTTQIVVNGDSSFLMPNSSDLINGLILSMEQAFPNDLSSDDISLLILIPSEADRSNKRLSPQSKQNLKSVMNRPYSGLKYLLLMCVDFDDNIDEFISISQLKLDLIYLMKCSFNAADPIWSVLCESKSLISSMYPEKAQCFQFAIPIGGHVTRIVDDTIPSFSLAQFALSGL